MRRSLPTMFTAAVLLVSLSGCAGASKADDTPKAPATTGSAGAAGPTIGLKSLQFMPMSMKVKVGTRVTWRNDEPISHTVTSGTVTGVDKTTTLRQGEKPDGVFNAKLSGKGDTFSYTYTKAGTFPYYCDIHKGMNAEIVVTP